LHLSQFLRLELRQFGKDFSFAHDQILSLPHGCGNRRIRPEIRLRLLKPLRRIPFGRRGYLD